MPAIAKHCTGSPGATDSGVSMPIRRTVSVRPRKSTSTVSPSTTRVTSAFERGDPPLVEVAPVEVTIGASGVVGPAGFPVLQDPMRSTATRVAPDTSALRLITPVPSDAHRGAATARARVGGRRHPTNTR